MKKVNQKGFISTQELGWVVLIIIGAIVAGYLIFVKHIGGPLKLTQPSGLPISSGLIPKLYASPQSEIAGWKTYHNSSYSFEIKYPPDWIINILSPSVISFTPRTNLTIFANPQRLSLEQWVKQERGTLVSKVQPIAIAGLSAIKSKESGLVEYDAVYFGKGQTVVSILSQEHSQDTDIFEKMITTFKFTQ